MPTDDTQAAYITPPQLAARLGVHAEKILQWIGAGEIRAVNVASDKTGKRPRWRIPLTEVARFETSRSNAPAPPPLPAKRRRRKKTTTRDWV